MDDQNYIARFDSQNALAIAAGQVKQLKYTDFDLDLPQIDQIDHVVLTGMGGSALAGLICRDWWDKRLKIPFVITRDYQLPAFVNKNTLVIASSYSGNTEETLSALEDAKAKGATVVVVTSGGKLSELARQNRYPVLSLPPDYQPRMSVWFQIKMLAAIFEKLGLAEGAVKELNTAQATMDKQVDAWTAPTPTPRNLAKQIAEQLAGKSVVVYAGPVLATAAYKWKINLNENAKNLAFYNVLPEFNHNEFVGWSSHPVQKPYAVVELISSLDHPRIQKRWELSNRLLSGKMPRPIGIKAEGKTQIEQLLWTILLGDFVSIYSGILNGVNPTPVELIEKLKKEL